MKLFNRELPSWTRYVVPPAIVFLGLLIMIGFIASRKRPQHKPVKVQGALVDVVQAHRAAHDVIVKGTGTVTPRQQINLIPQVSGRVDWVSPEFVSGGVFKTGDLMVRIEQDDYKLAVQQAEAAVAQAQYQQDVAKANADIARRQWERLQASSDSSPVAADPLVLHGPQLRQAEAALQSAQASLDRARLNLKRTEIRAPFNGRVRAENVSIGQVVSAQAQVGTFFGTDAAEVEVSLPLSDISWVKVPGGVAEVVLETGKERYSWEGHVERLTGVVDEIGRLERLFVVVDNPYDNQNPNGSELAMGSFVSVNISGRTLEDVIALPRKALRENDQLWVVSADSTLAIRDAEVLRTTTDEVIVGNGVDEGELVILTSITGAAPGMKLRPRMREEAR